MRVYKYKLNWAYTQVILPIGAKVLHFDIQNNEPHIWALVDPDAPKENRLFLLVGTGHQFDHDPDDTEFIGTVLANGGALVWHVFEILPLESRVRN